MPHRKVFSNSVVFRLYVNWSTHEYMTNRHEIDAIRGEIEDVDRKLGKLYDAVELGDISYDLLKPRLQEHKIRHDKLLGRKAEIELQLSSEKIDIATPEVVKAYVNTLHGFLDSGDLSDRRALINGFIKEVTVT